MPSSRETLLRCMRRLASRPETDHISDAALLHQFIAQRDQQAFTALVERHGAMVLQVCRCVLGNSDDAEDAFQGTFLVLVRKAAAVRPPEALAAWLHGVARRAALKTRAARIRRLNHARPLTDVPADRHGDPLADLTARELLMIVDEEVQRTGTVPPTPAPVLPLRPHPRRCRPPVGVDRRLGQGATGAGPGTAA
jgi:RNA polymerase sigma-70 factor (ECF subfamily)